MLSTVFFGFLIVAFTIAVVWFAFPILFALIYKSNYTNLNPDGGSPENSYAIAAGNSANPSIKLSRRKIKTNISGKLRADYESIYSSSGSIDLSVVIPAYNEQNRLSRCLDPMLDMLMLRERKGFSFEILIVNDCSTDMTAMVVDKYVKEYGSERIRMVDLQRNRGKGGSVCAGMVRSRGRFILMCDADGATKFESLEKMEELMFEMMRASVKEASAGTGLASSEDMEKLLAERFRGLVIGSRAKVPRDAIRQMLMTGFNFIVSNLCVSGFNDTQCGFKLFSREAAKVLFANLHLYRWAFDVELLTLAVKFTKVSVKEIDVSWEEIPGSKLDIFSATFQMLRDLLLIRLCYASGIWKPIRT